MSALPSFASVEELANWLGDPITEPGDVSRATGALRMASALVRTETGKSWVTEDGELQPNLPEALQLVTLAAAGRRYTNPDGITSERVDDAQISRKVDEAGLSLTASERDLLIPLSGSEFQGLSTVTTTRGERAPRDLYDPYEERILPPYY